MRMSKSILPILILFVISLFGNAGFAHEEDLEFFHPVTIIKSKPITIMDCVSLAYQNSPKIKRQKYNLDLAKSNVGLAKSAYFPVISAGTGFYNENNSDNVYYDRHYHDIPSVAVSINKMVWDFGKTTALIKMEEFYKIGAEYEFMDSLCSTLFDVKWKYYKLLRAKALKDIAEEDLKLTREALEFSKKSPDKETAKIYVNRAKNNLFEADNNFKNAKVDLDNSMYLSKSEDYQIADTNTFKFSLDSDIQNNIMQMHTFPFERANAVKIAYKNSPDLHVLIATRKAMEQSLNYVKRTYLPELGAGVAYGYNNSNVTSNSSLQVGVNLTSSVNLMELRHSIKGADAQLAIAQNEIDLFKKDLYYEIQRAFNNEDNAQARIAPALERFNDSKKTAAMVTNKYKQGELDYTSLHDAREDYIQAASDYAECLYSYNTALIQVEMAMHCHLVDIHHKSGHAVHHHSEELISDLIKALECTKEPAVKKNKFKSLLFGQDTKLDEDEDL